LPKKIIALCAGATQAALKRSIAARRTHRSVTISARVACRKHARCSNNYLQHRSRCMRRKAVSGRWITSNYLRASRRLLEGEGMATASINCQRFNRHEKRKKKKLWHGVKASRRGAAK